jgi:hypothetical protein
VTLTRRHRLALVAAVAFLLYLPSVRFDFTYDDAAVVENHPQVTGHAWGAMLGSPYHVGPGMRVATGIYRPLTVASLTLNHRISALEPWSYHLGNALLHALVTALVLALGEALGMAPLATLLGALAFAVHPVHVEAVANVAGRAELLSAACAVAALGLCVSTHAMTAWRWLGIGSLVLCGVFAKENVVTLAGVVTLVEVLRGWDRRRSPAIVAAVAVPLAAYLVARVLVLGGLGLGAGAVTPIENPIVGLSGVPRTATVLAVGARALSLLITPVRLAPDYGFAETVASSSLAAPGALVGVACLTAFLTAIAFSFRRFPLTAFLLGAAIVTYSIVSNAVVIIGTILGDRLLYFPSVFVCLLFGAGVAAIAGRWSRRGALILAGVMLAALTHRAATYEAVWRNDAALFEHAARVAPASVRNLGGWAALLAQSGRVDEALPLLDRAVGLAPDFVPNRLNRGAARLSAGRWEDAEADARRVLELDPGNAVAERQLRAAEAGRTR